MNFIDHKTVENETRNKFIVYFILRIRAIVYFILIAIIFYISVSNTTPFGARNTYLLSDKSIKPLSPALRVELINIEGATTTKMKDDLVYFTTKLPYQFDTAKIKIRFKSKGGFNSLSLGYKDSDVWHYNTQIIDMPFFHTGEWLNLGNGPVLYQKIQDWKSVSDFIANFKASSAIGVVDYSLPKENVVLENYTPSQTNTIIDVPLRGSHTMLVYLNGEAFNLKVTKRDLNWYNDADPLEISVYKDDTKVFTAEIDDDGITDDSKKTGITQDVEIKNPGPGLPEAGVYKIVFDSTGDTVITKIETNLHKIVFQAPVYPVSNAEVYPTINKTTIPNVLYTTSNKISLMSSHAVYQQQVIINGSTTPPLAPNLPQVVTSNATSSLNRIEATRSDILISGKGFYAFSEDQYFTPTRYNQIQITSNKDAELADYIMFGHKPYKITLDGYYEVEREFDLSSAVPDKNGLGWIIKASGLKENNGDLYIKDIEVTYSKKGWWYSPAQ